jgi:hypothetical protein
MPEAIPSAVEPDYFETLKVPLLAGRTFTAADDDENNAPVTIINRAFQSCRREARGPDARYR